MDANLAKQRIISQFRDENSYIRFYMRNYTTLSNFYFKSRIFALSEFDLFMRVDTSDDEKSFQIKFGKNKEIIENNSFSSWADLSRPEILPWRFTTENIALHGNIVNFSICVFRFTNDDYYLEPEDDENIIARFNLVTGEIDDISKIMAIRDAATRLHDAHDVLYFRIKNSDELIRELEQWVSTSNCEYLFARKLIKSLNRINSTSCPTLGTIIQHLI